MSDITENLREQSTRERSTRHAVNKALKDRDLPDLDEEEELEEEEALEIEQGVQSDVFDFCHPIAEKGDVVAYSIYKNSSFVAKKQHPYSWEKLQQEFGEGHYRVQAKSELTKKFLKQQANFVAAPEEKETKQTVADAVRSAMPPKADAFEEMSKMATLLKSLQPAPPPPAADNLTPVLMKLMEMQSTAQEKTMQMMLEMQKGNREMIEKMDQSQRATLEKLEAKISAGTGAKEKGMGAIELLNLVQGAESRGMKNYLMLEEMAEKKAAKMHGRNDDDDEKNESMTDKLIKTALPVITSALSQPRAVAPTPPVVQRQQLRPVANTRRPGPVPQSTAVKPVGVVSPATASAPTPAPVVEVLPPAAKTARPAPRAPLPSKDVMLDAIMPSIGTRLLESAAVQANPEHVKKIRQEAALETRAIITRMGAPLTHLLQSVKENDMIGIAKGMGLPDETHSWLREYYADLSILSNGSPKA